MRSYFQNKKNKKNAIIEIKGPKGCFILISILTDNINKTKAELTSTVKKHK